ncbi:MAG: hypothetical protein OHK0012_13840 [Synechococcales cyanobacterium]
MATSSWDPGRFWQTLWYYEVLPFSSEIRTWLGENRDPATLPPSVIWVAGQLSDRVGTPGDFPNTPQVVVRRINSTMVPQLSAQVQGVSGLVFVLGSPLDQHLPQIVAALDQYWHDYPLRLLWDFRDPASSALWGSLDDVVMGGVSSSQITFQATPQTARFTGTVSTANSGGFTSVRTRNLNPAVDLSAYQGISLRVKGDGQRYKFFLRSETGWDALAYSASFDTLPDEWQTITLPFTQWIPVFRARTRPDAPPLNTGQIYSFQLMLSKFEQDSLLNPHFRPGPFALELAWIGATGSRPILFVHPPEMPLAQSTQEFIDTLRRDPRYAVTITPTLPPTLRISGSPMTKLDE